jgi:4-hydroxyphenylacetate 3-monooxygenase oxygenase component
MGARSGAEYVESLREHQPEVYLEGQRVKDVTTEPIFAGPIESIRQQYDLQVDPRTRDITTYVDPDDGVRYSSSFLVPRSREQLGQRRQHFKLRCDHNFGFMGRAPDFMNALVTDFYLLRELFGRADPRYADNMAAYYQLVREGDLFLTHMLVNPQVDRSRSSAQQEDPFTHLGRVSANTDGIVVRGAKMLGTMAPLTEEVLVFPNGGIGPADEAYALAFGIPTNTPGLKFVCRETVAPGPRSRFDHPLSSRFEEMDCIAIFDDVLVPWDRVLVDGGSDVARDICNQLRPRDGTVAVQTCSRMLSQLEFFCGLAMRLADATAVDSFLHVQEKLGELVIELELFRAAYYGGEALARKHANGVWQVHQPSVAAANLKAARLYPRLVEIVQVLAGGGFFYAPTEADLANPDLRPLLDKYVKGRPGIDAEERIALFKLAWDVCGDGFGGRANQYAKFYSGDPIRNWAGFFLGYPYRQPLFDAIDRALGRVGDLDVPISPADPTERMARRQDPTLLAGTYPSGRAPEKRS